eukprot:3367195-Ditylum_brightwellii.AAC.1
MFKKAEARAKVCFLATGRKDQSRAAYCAEEMPPIPPAPAGAPPLGKTQGEHMDEYFDALALAASTDQGVLTEMVAPNSKLTKANLDLVTFVAQLTKANEAVTAKLGQADPGRQ